MMRTDQKHGLMIGKETWKKMSKTTAENRGRGKSEAEYKNWDNPFIRKRFLSEKLKKERRAVVAGEKEEPGKKLPPFPL